MRLMSGSSELLELIAGIWRSKSGRSLRDDFCQGASSGGDLQNLRMFTGLKHYAKCVHTLFVDTQSATPGMMPNDLAGGDSIVPFSPCCIDGFAFY